MPMTQEERDAADTRVRGALGVLRVGTGPDAPRIAPRAGSPLAVSASTKLPIEDEIYGMQSYGYGEVWGRAGLGLRERSYVTLGVLGGTRQSDQYGIHVNNALNLGLTPEEVQEVLVHAGVYAGGSVWHEGSNIVRYILVERGILERGPTVRLEHKPPTTREQRRDAAAEVKRALGVGRIGLDDDAEPLEPLPGSPAALTSATLPVEDEIRQVQDEHAYGEVWSRPALGLRGRSLITVALLQAQRLTGPLHQHINIALNLGVTPEELHEVFLHAGVYSGAGGWENAVAVARHVFLQRGILEPDTAG
jgi:4-carboxymuconolactone decarboxylase